MHSIVTSRTIALLILALAAQLTFAQNFESDTINLRDADTSIGFEILDDAVNNYEVFITGENHSYLESNSKLWVKQIKYLYHNAGVRNIMIEYGFASGWLINEYLQEGDTNHLNILKDYSFKQFASAYEELHEFNDSLPDNEKIHLVGIDLERGIYSAAKVLSLQLPEEKVPHDSIALDIESLKSLVSYNDNEIFGDNDRDFFNSYSASNTLNRILSNFNAHKNHYKDFLEDKYVLFERILTGFADQEKWKEYQEDNSTHQFVFREKYMFDRFKEEFKNCDGKFFGQFGRCHTAKSTQEQNSCNWYHFKSLANRIEESPELKLKNKVMTTGILYKSDVYEDEAWADMDGHIDSLFDLMVDDRILLYNLPKDSLLSKKLEGYFDFVLINTTKASSNYPNTNLEDLNMTGGVSKSKFLFSAGLLNIDLAELNDLLVEYEDPFDNGLIIIGAEIVTTNKNVDWIKSNLTVTWIVPQKRVYDNLTLQREINMKLSGIFLNNFTAFNLTNKIDAIDIMPGIGLGISRLKLKVDETSGGPIRFRHGFIGDRKTSEYANPALTFTLGGEVDLNLGPLTIGGTGGYQYDLSKKRWLTDKILLDNGPETSLRGWYAQFHIGFNFGQ